jgi:MinD superfamily P-loop ATPase
MIISVASGKGGTGKTLVATSLALSLQNETKVQFLDCDVEEPDAHILLKPAIEHQEVVSIPIPEINAERCTYCGKCAEVCAYNALAILKNHALVFAELCHGCGACSYLCPEDAISEVAREIGIVETGRAKQIEFIHGRLAVGEAMAPPVIRSVKEHIDPGKTVIIDVSPGTSCPVVEAVKGSDYCLLVTEPTPFGLNDLTLAVETIKKLEITCGVVINRAGVGDNKVEEYCLKEAIPVLLQIPLDIQIARLYSQGIPLVEGIPQWRPIFHKLFEDIDQIVSTQYAKRSG